MMKQKLFRVARVIFPYLLTVLVLGAGAIYITGNLDQFRELRFSSWWWMAALIGSCFGNSLASALIIQRLLRIFQLRLGFWEAVGLNFLTAFGNLLLPVIGGVGLRAAYLKKRHAFPLGYFASTAAGAAMLTIAINALVGLTMVSYIFFSRELFSLPIFVIFFTCLLVPGLLIIIPARKIRGKGRLAAKINMAWQGWGMISRSPGDVLVLALFGFLSAFSAVLMLYSSFRVVSESILLSEAAIVSSMTSFSTLFKITPASLGISELVIVFTSRALGYVVVASVSAALIQRAVSMVEILVGAGITSWLLPRGEIKPPGRKGGKAGESGEFSGEAQSGLPLGDPLSNG